MLRNNIVVMLKLQTFITSWFCLDHIVCPSSYASFAYFWNYEFPSWIPFTKQDFQNQPQSNGTYMR